MTTKERLQKKLIHGKNLFVANTATVIGDVEIGDDCSVWFGAVIRGDSDIIRIGNRSNVQDNAVIHCDPGAPAIIGDDCVIGHCAIVHGAQLGNCVLVGMHATVLNNARIGNNVIIGANALVTGGMEIPDNSLVLGAPAKVVKGLSPEQIEGIKENARVYVEKAADYLHMG
ncbi:MAG: gamma carbonic anhydrase family protein [Bacteroidota bacterium]|nr:gamma carbonic anhydrase family protein [Bacteroidota bacterium]MDX5430962.1 gamma carbonic anhydrase family protein [Bacteroidota bacterium]MDX5469713.1 gamma carbonic anhydrase family protein [Bacteroidota bacterium]